MEAAAVLRRIAPPWGAALLLGFGGYLGYLVWDEEWYPDAGEFTGAIARVKLSPPPPPPPPPRASLLRCPRPPQRLVSCWRLGRGCEARPWRRWLQMRHLYVVQAR